MWYKFSSQEIHKVLHRAGQRGYVGVMAQAPLDINDWRCQRYLEWLCSVPKEREPRTKVEFAETIGVTHKTLNNWTNNADFLREWERLYLKTIGDPGAKLEIMQTLRKTATDPDDPKHVSAAKTYFEIEGSMKPQRMEVSVNKDASKLTDEELESMLSAHAQSEVERRGTANTESTPIEGGT